MPTRVHFENILFVLFLTIFANKFYQVKCDLPVHCLPNQIAGEWVFFIDQLTFTPSHDKDSSCGHGVPDKPDQTVSDIDYEFPNHKKLEITLSKDHKVYEKGLPVGKWTSVYDEGFILDYKNSQFTTFMKYFKNEGNTFSSNCDKTMKGWFIPNIERKRENWSCFFGKKASVTKSPASFLQINKIKKQTSIIYDLKKMPAVLLQTKALAAEEAHIKYEEHKHIVDEINAKDLTWKAHVNPSFVGLSLFQLHEKLGIRNRYVREETNENITNLEATNTDEGETQKESLSEESYSKMELDSAYVNNYEQISKYIEYELNDIPKETLPRNWDWRNVGGVNFVPEIRRQENCGSCYVFSTVASLESRLRILTNNKDKTTFSRQFPISCNFYTEGCHGGYPILVAKFFSEFELVPEDCFPYEAKNVSCEKVCDYTSFPKKYTAERVEYLGGFYGATTEELMMKEIRARGPIPGNLRVPQNLFYYKHGIYSNFHKKKQGSGINDRSMINRGVDWMKVEHSILIVGWGEENGVKYWICMNTWGKEFGENGFFRILRGVNECNIETMGDSFRIKVGKRSKML